MAEEQGASDGERVMLKKLMALSKSLTWKEGFQEGVRVSLIGVIIARGLELSPEATAKIRECRDDTTLGTWIGRAVDAKSLNEIFR